LKKMNFSFQNDCMNVTRLPSIIGISLGCIVMGLVFTMVNATLPTIQKSLNVPLYQMQWMMLSFGIMNCALLVTSGRLADIYGRRKIFLIGLCISGIGMSIAGMSQGGPGLICSMILAGIGNAILLPVSQAMLTSEFPKSDKSRAIGIWALVVSCSMALGPLLAGALSQTFGWRWVFWSMIPLFILSFIFIFLYTQETKNTIDAPQLDIRGMILIGVCFSSFIFLATEYNRLSLVVNAIFFLISLLTFWALWINSHTFSFPILLPELIKNKQFAYASIASCCLCFCIWSTFFLLPIYFENIRFLNPFLVGFLMLGITIPVIILSPIIGKVYRPYHASKFIFFGFLFLIFSSITQIFFGAFTPLSFIAGSTLLLGIGNALITGPTITAAISVVPPHKAGIASGTFITFQEIGGTLGLAFVVTMVRLSPNLAAGIQNGVYLLLLINILGAFCGLLMLTTTRPDHLCN
jgi:EmrB/QacA subfamily drug resistance transporter